MDGFPPTAIKSFVCIPQQAQGCALNKRPRALPTPCVRNRKLRPWDIRGLRYGDTDTQQVSIIENVSSPQGTEGKAGVKGLHHSQVKFPRRWMEAMDSAGLVVGRCGLNGRLTAWMRAQRIEGRDEQMGLRGES